MNKHVVKIIIFILLILVFIFILFYDLFGLSISLLSEKEIVSTRNLNDKLINSIKINNIETVYDKNSKLYYYHISAKNEGNNYILKLNLKDDLKYKIIGYKFNIINVNYIKPIDVIIYNDKYYYKITIQLTNIPLISINSEEEIIDSDVNSNFIYINVDNNQKVVTSNIKIHVRGATSRYLPKQSYKFEYYNDDYSKAENNQIEDFYKGSSLILDAMYRDSSKMRNILATELWNNVSKDFSSTSIKYQYVELFINNEHKGLYILTEPINRTSLNLEKDTSIIIKTTSWDLFDGATDFSNIKSENFKGMELKYPNNSKMYQKSWEKFLNIIYTYYTSKITDKVISTTFNMNNYIDLVVFNFFVSNIDNNIIKNNYLYLKTNTDNEVFIQPWDMEFTFGILYSSSSLHKVTYYNNVLIDLYNSDAVELNKLIKKRYYELRSTVFTEEYIYEIIDDYYDILKKGAATRDCNLWVKFNLNDEVKMLKEWIKNRIKFVDKYVEEYDYEK